MRGYLCTSGGIKMLNMRFGKTVKTNFKMSSTFDWSFENLWMKDELVRAAIRDIDKSEVIGDRVIDSPVLGTISHKDLSGGVKTVILTLFKPEMEYNGSGCGDNCNKWFLEVAKRHDIYLAYGHIPRYPEPFEIRIVNNGVIVTTHNDLVDIYIALNRYDGTYIGEDAGI